MMSLHIFEFIRERDGNGFIFVNHLSLKLITKLSVTSKSMFDLLFDRWLALANDINIYCWSRNYMMDMSIWGSAVDYFEYYLRKYRTNDILENGVAEEHYWPYYSRIKRVKRGKYYKVISNPPDWNEISVSANELKCEEDKIIDCLEEFKDLIYTRGIIFRKPQKSSGQFIVGKLSKEPHIQDCPEIKCVLY